MRRGLAKIPPLCLAAALLLAAKPAPRAKKEAPAEDPAPLTELLARGAGDPDRGKKVLESLKDSDDPTVLARLGDRPTKDEPRPYHFYITVRMPANLTVTHRVLTDYTIFARIVPFVKTAEYNAENHILDLRGGIFGFELHSLIQFH
ncbi:MAG TPA: hypothetical protein VL588_05830, partial [Bdellovibrionota bacterium]|nr:hypothetical protein [Bdellovibrionota bacterium]